MRAILPVGPRGVRAVISVPGEPSESPLRVRQAAAVDVLTSRVVGPLERRLAVCLNTGVTSANEIAVQLAGATKPLASATKEAPVIGTESPASATKAPGIRTEPPASATKPLAIGTESLANATKPLAAHAVRLALGVPRPLLV
jgi:hypothetical protein